MANVNCISMGKSAPVHPRIGSTPSLAIIIPTLNEATHIAHTLTHVASLDADFCVVVDGGSHDNTAHVAQQHPSTPMVLSVSGGRAAQLNAAVARVTQDIVLILSADCRMSRSALHAIRHTIQRGVIAGCLRMRHSTQHVIAHLSDVIAGLRAGIIRGGYADQAPFFLRRAAQQFGFRELGTYDTADLGQRLSKYGTFSVLPATVIASSRYWHQWGLFRGTLLHQKKRLRHWLRQI
jgi:glycosyltransferase involved in cell wall biosynthesis